MKGWIGEWSGGREFSDIVAFDEDPNDRSVNSLRPRTMSSSHLLLCQGLVLIT